MLDGFLVRLGVYGLGWLLRHMVQLFQLGVDGFLCTVRGLWFGLVGVAHRSIGLDCWRKVFGKVACLGFELVGVAHGSICLVWGWTVFSKVGV